MLVWYSPLCLYRPARTAGTLHPGRLDPRLQTLNAAASSPPGRRPRRCEGTPRCVSKQSVNTTSNTILDNMFSLKVSCGRSISWASLIFEYKCSLYQGLRLKGKGLKPYKTGILLWPPFCLNCQQACTAKIKPLNRRRNPSINGLVEPVKSKECFLRTDVGDSLRKNSFKPKGSSNLKKVIRLLLRFDGMTFAV